MVGRAILPAAAFQAALLLTGISCSNHKPSPKMIVLGIDGMDPVFLENHWSQLPNLNRLHQEGDFKRLATTTPPQSPVAWSTFITGLNPDGHGIYDFIHADRATHMPHSSMAETRPGRKLQIGPYSLPVTSDRIENQRRVPPSGKSCPRPASPRPFSACPQTSRPSNAKPTR